MNPEANDNAGLRRFLAVIRRRWIVVLLAMIVLPVVAYTLSSSQEKEYRSAATLLFKPSGLNGLIEGASVSAPSTDLERQAATNVDLASLDRVAEGTAKALGRGHTPSEVKSHVTVSAEGSSDLATVQARGPTGEQAARLANTYAEQFIEFRRDADRRKIRAAETRLRAQINKVNRRIAKLETSGREARGARADLIRAERSSLRHDRANLLQSAGRLRDLAALDNADVELVQNANVPSVAASPRPKRDALLGLALGLVLGIGLAFLFELLDRRLKAPEEVAEIFGRPVIATIPHSRALANPATRQPAGTDTAAFQMLRANLHYFNVDRDVCSVLVTSPAPGDGKSTVSWFLAAAAAEAGRKVLLIEAELRRPSFGTKFGLPTTRGLSDVLSGHAQPNDVLVHVPVGTRTNGTAQTLTMDVLAAGPLPVNPADLMESEQMATLLREAESVYDLVVIDTPPVAVISDAVPLVRQVGGVLVVMHLGKTTRESGGHLQAQLENLNAPILGVVVTNVAVRDGFYGSTHQHAARYTTAPDDVPRASAR